MVVPSKRGQEWLSPSLEGAGGGSFPKLSGLPLEFPLGKGDTRAGSKLFNGERSL